jgi:transposase
MARKHPRSYPPEFRRNIIELVRSGRTMDGLSSEFKIARQTIANWIRQDDLDTGLRSDGLTSAEHDEVSKLRKRVRQLEIERDILSKAAAWFARETDSIPTKSSNS